MATTTADDAPNTFSSIIDRTRVTTLLSVAAAIALIVAVALWAREPEMRPLYASLPDRDANAVVQSLQQMNVPFKMADSGGAILVPATQIHDVRLKLASQGLPRNGTPGFELFETQKWGITQFQEQVNFQRALEGELARSIQSLSAVQGARVHLAMPRESGFMREQERPTASVLLTLAGGQTLDRSQVAGIVHLVASSVNNLAPKAVSVVDQSGALLSSSGTDDTHLDPTQLAYVSTLEGGFARRLDQILAPLLGRTNYRAQVHAEVDFTESESSDELYKPNRTPGEAIVRSENTSEAVSNNPVNAQGVPGALSNQPAVTGQGAGNGAVSNASADAKGTTATQRNSVTNYELNKTVRYTRPQVGAVKRLSAAIVINLRKPDKPDGKPQPLSDAELENITALAKQAIGFREERGDTIKVSSATFALDPVEVAQELPLWRKPEVISLAIEIGKYLLATLLIAYLFFSYVKPALKHLVSARLQAPAAEGDALSDQSGAGAHGSRTGDQGALALPDPLESARDIARRDPKLVANMVSAWVNNG